MALEVGSVFARVGARFDDDGFNRWERAFRSAKQDARHPIEAKARLDVDERGFKRWNDGVDRAEHGSTRLRGALGAAGASARVAVAGAGAAGIGVGLMAKSFVDAGSDINESLSKNQVLFGRYAKDVDDFSKKSATTYGISRRALLEYTGTFGNLFRAVGESRKGAASMSTDLTKLAADMASFNNASIEEIGRAHV